MNAKNFILSVAGLIFSLTASAAEINFLVNPEWTTVLKRAKAENKLIFLDGYATWCGPCKKMDSDVYTDPAVAEYYNTSFINVKYDMETGDGKMLAEKFKVTAYPSLLYVNPAGLVIHKGVGYREPAQFLALGKDAINPNTQYGSLKLRASALSPTDFIKFAIAAAEFQDEDYDDIARTFLSKQPDVLANNELISIVMKGITYLPDENVLAYIVANKAKIKATAQYSDDEISQRLIGLTLAYSVFSNTDDASGETDVQSVTKMLEKYIPENAFFVSKYFQAEYALEREDPDAAARIFEELLAAPADKVTFEQIANAFMAFVPAFNKKEQLDKYFALFDARKVSAGEEKNAYLRNFVKAVVYLKIKDEKEFKKYADILLKDAGTPEEVKAQLKAVLEQQH